MKTCIRCFIELVIPDNWTLGRRKASDYRCKACRKLENAKHIARYRVEHAVESAERTRKWREDNPERYAEQKTKYMTKRRKRDE